jgi:hypothetical protein
VSNTARSGDKLRKNKFNSWPIPLGSTKYMYKNKSNRSPIDAALSASLGAGVVTSFAIAQGQHPALAIAITAIATLFAVICYKFDLI